MIIGSAGLRYVSWTEISDGRGGQRTVSLGQKVDMLPFEQTETGKRSEVAYLARHTYEVERKSLGKGPFIIRQIGRWPCGRIMLYVNDGTGVYADDMMAV